LGRENPGGLEPRGDAERIEYHFRDKALVRQSWPTANPNVASEPGSHNSHSDRTGPKRGFRRRCQVHNC
jgi:hypothetical protein